MRIMSYKYGVSKSVKLNNNNNINNDAIAHLLLT